MTRRIAVFDLGNVVVRWDRRYLYEKLIADATELDWFLENVLTLAENAVLDRGTPLPEMTRDLARRHPAQADLIDAFRTRWSETVGEVLDQTVAVLDELSEGGVPCYALSNWGADTFEQVRDGFGWLDRFAGVVISGQEGVVKPDPAIFTLLCERYRFEPDEAVFIDDSPANVAAAQALGFASLLFSESLDLRAALIAQGLPVAVD